MRGLVEGWNQFPQPEPVSGGVAAGGSGAIYTRGWSDFRAHTDCVFTADRGWVVPAWGGVFATAGVIREPADRETGLTPMATWTKKGSLVSWRGAQDGLPVDDGVPQHALITAIEIAMQRIEVETDDVAAADG